MVRVTFDNARAFNDLIEAIKDIIKEEPRVDYTEYCRFDYRRDGITIYAQSSTRSIFTYLSWSQEPPSYHWNMDISHAFDMNLIYTVTKYGRDNGNLILEDKGDYVDLTYKSQGICARRMYIFVSQI